MYVDAMAMDLVRRPERYEVVVASNLFGDIVSDLAAEVTGGLGLAPSANVHPGRHALFEPVHGSAPDIVGTGRANPVGAIRCVALLLDHFGHAAAAGRVDASVVASIRERATTPDLGGALTTEEVGAWIADHLAGTWASPASAG
jgi:isocitrate/isopropylmalate dehydrogenase